MDRARCRVLIVEDHTGTRDFVGDLLSAEGFETRQAADGREALVILERFRPDLILLDLELPIMDGRALLDELGRSERLAGIPTIIISAYGGRWDAPISLRQVAGLLRKPFDPDALLGAIGRALDRGASPSARAAEPARNRELGRGDGRAPPAMVRQEQRREAVAPGGQVDADGREGRPVEEDGAFLAALPRDERPVGRPVPHVGAVQAAHLRPRLRRPSRSA